MVDAMISTPTRLALPTASLPAEVADAQPCAGCSRARTARESGRCGAQPLFMLWSRGDKGIAKL
jgi:hypothetical protein